MKIAITKIGANITFSKQNKSAANADILYALRTLGVKEQNITIHTAKTRNTFIPKVVSFKEIKETTDFNEYHVVLVFNGSINFYGGTEDLNLIALYKALARTKRNCKIVYVQTDGALWFQELWPLIAHRDWAQKYSSEDFDLDTQNVFYITQGRGIRKVYDEMQVKTTRIFARSVYHFPWEQTILSDHEKFFHRGPVPFNLRPYDLAFGGATRNTYKRKKIEKYYNSPRLKTLLFGNLRGVHCPNATMASKVAYQEFIPMMSNAKGTVIFGDHFYNNNFFTLRMYESILAGNILLIDEEFDSSQSFFWAVDPDIRSFFYVNNVAEVEEAMRRPNLEGIAE